MNKTTALQYLENYGYMDHQERRRESGESYGYGYVKEALLDFQAFGGINQTGVLDQETMKLMEKPRCGVRDRIRDDSLSKKSNRLYLSSFFQKKYGL